MRKGTQIYTNIDEFAARSRTESPSNLPKKSETELNSTKSMLSPTESYSRTVLGTFSSISTFLSSNSSSDTIESSKNRKLLSNTSFLLDTLLSEDKYDRKIRPNFGGKFGFYYLFNLKLSWINIILFIYFSTHFNSKKQIFKISKFPCLASELFMKFIITICWRNVLKIIFYRF